MLVRRPCGHGPPYALRKDRYCFFCGQAQSPFYRWPKGSMVRDWSRLAVQFRKMGRELRKDPMLSWIAARLKRKEPTEPLTAKEFAGVIAESMDKAIKVALTEVAFSHFPVLENAVLQCRCGYRKEVATRYDWGDHIIEVQLHHPATVSPDKSLS